MHWDTEGPYVAATQVVEYRPTSLRDECLRLAWLAHGYDPLTGSYELDGLLYTPDHTTGLMKVGQC